MSNSLVVNGIRYEILERLSRADRGRWKVQRANLYQRKTIYTVCDLSETESSLQFLSVLKSLPENVNGIPHLIDTERKNGRLLLVISWCQGTDLNSYFRRFANYDTQPISAFESIKRIKSLAHTCNILHEKLRIIHGDLKPANLVIPSQPGTLWIIDFGSSWPMESTRGKDDGDGAEVHYSAPEVFDEGILIDDRADQFSMAVILFRMMTGVLPFSGLGGLAGHPQFKSEFLAGIESPTEQTSQLRRLPQKLRRQIDGLLARSLQLDRNLRYPSTRAFVRAIDQLHESMRQAEFAESTMPLYIERLIGFIDRFTTN